MPVVLAPFVNIAAYLVAFGLTILAIALVIAVFSFAEKTVGWIPFVGGWSKKKLHDVGQSLNSYMRNAASSYAHSAVVSFHTLTDALKWSADAFLDMSEWVHRIEWYILKKFSLALMHNHLAKLLRIAFAHDRRISDAYERIHDAERPLAHPESGPIAAGARVVTRPLSRDFARFRRQAMARLRALEHAIAVDLPHELKGTREIAKEAERVAHRLWAQVKRLDKVTTGALATTLVGSAIIRLGGGWLFCRNWRLIGRGVCRLPPELIGGIFGLGVPLLLASDLCLVARLFENAARAALPALRELVVVANAAVNCSREGPPPAMALATTALPVVDGYSDL